MLACLGELPAVDDDYAYEIKWDGMRALVYIDGAQLKIESRNLREVTGQYPELLSLSRLGRDGRLVLDGEIVAFDANDRPSFELMQGRMHIRPEIVPSRQRAIPVHFMVFDILEMNSEPVLDLTYSQRRALLDQLELDDVPHVKMPPYRVGGGDEMLAASRTQGLEGIVAKRLDSTYEPAKRTGAWIKIKNQLRQEFVVGGWLPGEGSRRNKIGALLTGYWLDDELHYAGRVGTGFTQQTLAMLAEKMLPLRRDDSPFSGEPPHRDAVYIEPELVCEVEFTEWTSAGTMRHPSFKGLRNDKDPHAVVRETAA